MSVAVPNVWATVCLSSSGLAGGTEGGVVSGSISVPTLWSAGTPPFPPAAARPPAAVGRPAWARSRARAASSPPARLRSHGSSLVYPPRWASACRSREACSSSSSRLASSSTVRPRATRSLARLTRPTTLLVVARRGSTSKRSIARCRSSTSTSWSATLGACSVTLVRLPAGSGVTSRTR